MIFDIIYLIHYKKFFDERKFGLYVNAILILYKNIAFRLLIKYKFCEIFWSVGVSNI